MKDGKAANTGADYSNSITKPTVEEKMEEQELLLLPCELNALKGNEWISGRWYYDPYEIMRAQIAKIKEAGYVKLNDDQKFMLRNYVPKELPDIIGTTLDGQPLIKQAGGK